MVGVRGRYSLRLYIRCSWTCHKILHMCRLSVTQGSVIMTIMKIAIHFLTHLQTFSSRDNLEFWGLGLIKFFVVFSLQVIEKLSLSIIAHSLPLQK